VLKSIKQKRLKSISKIIPLGFIRSKIFDDFLIIPFSKDWITLNNGKTIEFFVEVKEGKLILSGKLALLDKTREVDSNAM